MVYKHLSYSGISERCDTMQPLYVDSSVEYNGSDVVLSCHVALSVVFVCLQHSCFCTASCSVFIREEKKAKKLNKNEKNCKFLRHRPRSVGEKPRKRASGGESMREENRAVNGSWGEIKQALCLFSPLTDGWQQGRSASRSRNIW